MTFETIAGLREGIRRAREQGGVRALILTGTGEKAFCAGGDLGGMTGGDAEAAHEGRGHLAGLFTDMWHAGIPTIAKVRGYALAGGMGLALACDIVIAAEDAVFGTPEVSVGLWPYMITVPLLQSMPPKVALELMMTGRRVPAEEASRLGLVSRVVPADQLDESVNEIAQSIARNSPAAIRLGRTAFYQVLNLPAEQALPLLQAGLGIASGTADAIEGTRAFAEKRAPIWGP
jgi:enoyl-CoA hydratase/carnithine racemase